MGPCLKNCKPPKPSSATGMGIFCIKATAISAIHPPERVLTQGVHTDRHNTFNANHAFIAGYLYIPTRWISISCGRDYNLLFITSLS